MREEALERMRDALTELSEDHAEVIRLRSLEGLSVAEVGERMERSENAVRILYCRALKALRVVLDDSI
jgi:RNA polymerase sigma-70 factor (ECF subfamily)